MKGWTGNPFAHFGLPARVGWMVVGAYGAAGVLVEASWVWHWEGTYPKAPVDEMGSVTCLLFAALCAGYAAHFAVGRCRYGWLAMVTALLGWAAGEVLWTVDSRRPDIGHTVPPAAAELALGLFPIGALIGLPLLSPLSRHSPRRLVLDGLIVATSLFVVSWVFVIEKQFAEDSSSRPATLAQVFADVVMMTTGILMLSRVRPGALPSRSLVAAGVVTIAAADIAMVFETGVGGYHVGQLAELGRVVGLAELALAGLSSVSESHASDRPDAMTFQARLWLPYLPLLLAAAGGFRSP